MDLPGEVLDDILQRVRPRHLAACRRVCKDWRAAIDGRGLVLAHLTPRPPRGIFINFFGTSSHSFFSRDDAPTSPCCISSKLLFLPDWRPMVDRSRVLDHSNGLILYANGDAMYVCNPVTRRWETLPPPPRRVPFLYTRAYLVFDPAVSLRYDVLFFPDVPERPSLPGKRLGKGRPSRRVINFMNIENLPPPLKSKYEHDLNTVGSMEWPPYSYSVQAFSSTTGQWQARHFIRQGNTAFTVADVWSDPHAANGWSPLRRHGVYWQGAFYLHCGVDFIMRLSFLNGNYLVIKTPTPHNFFRGSRSQNDESEEPHGYFGKSKQGIYYTVVHGYQLSVWVLQEATNTGRALEWELRHQRDLETTFHGYYNKHPRGDVVGKSWTLDPNEEGSSERVDSGWDSSDDNVTDAQEQGIDCKDGHIKCYYGMDFLGYHPQKEILFLGSRYKGFSYYLGTSKLQYLGLLYPNGQYHIPIAAPTLDSFVYTPCVDDLLPTHNDP